MIGAFGLSDAPSSPSGTMTSQCENGEWLMCRITQLAQLGQNGGRQLKIFFVVENCISRTSSTAHLYPITVIAMPPTVILPITTGFCGELRASRCFSR